MSKHWVKTNNENQITNAFSQDYAPGRINAIKEGWGEDGGNGWVCVEENGAYSWQPVLKNKQQYWCKELIDGKIQKITDFTDQIEADKLAHPKKWREKEYNEAGLTLTRFTELMTEDDQSAIDQYKLDKLTIQEKYPYT